MNLIRLHAAIVLAGVPIEGVDENGRVTPTSLQAAAQPTINAFDASASAQEAWVLQTLYAQAKGLLTADDPISTKEKAVLLTILDEFNAHANKINAIRGAIANAATFAAAKTAVTAITDYPPRTASQIKTSGAAKIDAGQANG